jgi:galactokinase
MTGTLLATFAPGRVNLIGEHTDYSGGLVLPAAIELGVTVEVEGEAAEIFLASREFGGAGPFAPDGGGPATSGWGRYAQAVAAELGALGRPPVGLRAHVSSSLPAGTGLSSSAAVELAVALALCGVAGFELEPLELALACQRAELRAVGVPCGILDQAASALGRAGEALLLDCGTLAYRYVAVPGDAALVVLDSGVERRLEGSGYAARRAELEQALQLSGATRSTELSAGDLPGLDPVSLRRLRHVVTENERVRSCAAALEAGDLRSAGRLLTESHASLRDDYEVSLPELDLLSALAVEAGAFGARLLGGGFGGSVLALADAAGAADLGAAVGAGYAARTGRPGRAVVVHPSAGARRVEVGAGAAA